MESSNESYTLESFWPDYNSTSSMSPLLPVVQVGIAGIITGYTVVFLIMTTNIVSLIAFAVEKKLRTYNNYFIINLVLSDLLTGIACIVFCFYDTYDYIPFLESKGFCRVFNGFRQGIPAVSNLGMVAICYDRYRATYEPIRHFTSRSKRRAVIINAIVWLASLGFWYSYDLIWDSVLTVSNGRNCVPTYAHSAILTTVPIVPSIFLPLAVVSSLYFRIYIKIQTSVGGRNVIKKFKNSFEKSNDTVSELRSNDKVTKGNTMDSSEDQTITSVSGGIAASGVEPGQPENFSTHGNDCGKSQKLFFTTKSGAESSEKITKRKSSNRESTAETRRATHTLFFIIIAFCIAWIPISTLQVIYAFNPNLISIGDLHLYPYFAWLSYANSFFNPISYIASQRLFRKTVIGILCHPTNVFRK